MCPSTGLLCAKGERDSPLPAMITVGGEPCCSFVSTMVELGVWTPSEGPVQQFFDHFKPSTNEPPTVDAQRQSPAPPHSLTSTSDPLVLDQEARSPRLSQSRHRPVLRGRSQVRRHSHKHLRSNSRAFASRLHDEH